MKSSWKSLSLVLSATVALSIALNLLQAKRILDLEEGPGAPPSSVLRTGSQAPDLHAKDLLGNDFVLSFHSKLPKPVVLYVFSQSCHWCQRNSPSINSLVAQVGSKYRFIGLSLSDTGVGPFLKQHQHVFPHIRTYRPIPFPHMAWVRRPLRLSFQRMERFWRTGLAHIRVLRRAKSRNFSAFTCGIGILIF
jgi:hypothetical protein